MPTRRQFVPSLPAFAVAFLLVIGSARAAEPPPFTAAQLDQMLASIALFPDALLSQVLMASTYPSDVAEAVDWAYAHRDQFEGDAAVEAVRDQPWDPSVQSLVAFPQVLAMFGESPQWVRDLGDAFLAQPGEVMDSVQFLRSKAKAAGNLESNEQQIITIEPAPPPPQVIVVNAPAEPESLRENKMKQRDYMRMLFQNYDNNEDILVREYADAEKRGIVHRTSNQHRLTSEQYAQALYKDGMKKSWIHQAPVEKWGRTKGSS